MELKKWLGIGKASPEEELKWPQRQIEAIRRDPKKIVTIYRCASMNGAIREAQKINLGLESLFDSSTFWAGYLRDEKARDYVVVLGLRSHLPEGWRKFVTGA